MDWKSLIADLAEQGYTQPQIAAACDCAQSTVSDLANGKAKRGPGFELGQRLATLHKRVMAKAKKAKTAHQ